MEIKENAVYNCDCLELMREMKNESVNLILTDPPYLTTARGSAGNSGGMLQKEINKKGKVFKNNAISCCKYAPEFYRILKNNSHCYIMTNHKNLIEMLNTFVNAGFHFIKALIWDKTNKIMGQYYMSQFEYILFFRKGKGKKINNCGTSDILSIPNKKTKLANGSNLHDTEKPVELIKILIENSTKENEIVFDAFGGSFSTYIACLKTGRRYIGAEIDKEYFDMGMQRLNNLKSQITFFD